MRRLALVSVFDKTGVDGLARRLVAAGFEIISTGGTLKLLEKAGVPVQPVSAITGFPEILDGRVKSLHPKIHAGLLARRDAPEHLDELARLGIPPIDVVVCNLYPFARTIAAPGVELADALENIDIGGPAMIRAAAKNFPAVTVVVDPADYDRVAEHIESDGEAPFGERRELAAKAFRHTAEYDRVIAGYMGPARLPDEDAQPRDEHAQLPDKLTIVLHKVSDLRYGENPHQDGAFYAETVHARAAEAPAVVGSGAAPASEVVPRTPGFQGIRQLGGKELSYNNIADTDAALALMAEFDAPVAVGVKHATPCAVALGADVGEAVTRMLALDPVSIFGGIVAVNREIDERAATCLAGVFLEVVVAPGFSSRAETLLRAKTKLRLLLLPEDWNPAPALELKHVAGGYLAQTPDPPILGSEDPRTWRLVSGPEPAGGAFADLLFGWTVVKHVRSNAIVVVKNGQTIGIDGGQVNRIDAARHALARAGEGAKGAVLASDAFFPMPDVVEEAARFGIAAIVQPGGSLRDNDSIEAADEHGITMLFTGRRHFRH